jgi:hypothetical protein
MPVINLNQFDTSISSKVGTANVTSNESAMFNAVAGLGDKALGIFSDMAIKDRQQDIKQSAWSVQSNFEQNLLKTSLDAKGRVDTNGKIIALDADGNQKRNSEGNLEYELDSNNKVVQVVAVNNNVITDSNGIEQENLGVEFLRNLYSQPEVNWKKTSYNTIENKHEIDVKEYKKISGTHSKDKDIFSKPSDFTVNSKGEIYLIDDAENTIRKIDENGKVVLT